MPVYWLTQNELTVILFVAALIGFALGYGCGLYNWANSAKPKLPNYPGPLPPNKPITKHRYHKKNKVIK